MENTTLFLLFETYSFNNFFFEIELVQVHCSLIETLSFKVKKSSELPVPF